MKTTKKVTYKSVLVRIKGDFEGFVGIFDEFELKAFFCFGGDFGEVFFIYSRED